MHLIFIYGPPASGKYTIAKQVADRTDYALFHNHLIVDAVASVFPFGSANFVRLREMFWLETLTRAVQDNRSVIFTFQPEPSVSPDFPEDVRTCIQQAGGRIDFVRLTLSWSEQEARVANQDRAVFGKLRSVELLKSLHAGFQACEDAMPEPAITIDTASHTPDESLELIVQKFHLGG